MNTRALDKYLSKQDKAEKENEKYELEFDEDECSKLELDEKGLKSVLRDAGIFNTRIV